MLFLILLTYVYSKLYPNVGKLYIGHDCTDDNLFGIASVLKKSMLGFLELPRVMGSCQQEQYYDSYLHETIDIAMIQECNEETNKVTTKGWHNSTICLDTPSDWIDERTMGDCENHNNTEISTSDWCTHDVTNNLPHLSIYNGDNCDDENKLYDLWARPNYCIYVHFDGDHDIPISFMIKKDNYNHVSAHQYNSTNCNETTEIWSEQYTLGVCHLSNIGSRRGSIGQSLSTSNVLLVSENIKPFMFWIIPAIIVPIIVVILLCVAVVSVLLLYKRSQNSDKYSLIDLQ